MPKPAWRKAPSRETRLPLVKYSHTSALNNYTGVLTWTHVNGNGDLACVFEKFPGDNSNAARLILRVTRHDGILEQLDLAYFVRMTSSDTQTEFISLPKPPFAVMVKSPSLAVKYPQSDTHARRFQIKFMKNSDYFVAISMLSEINCPLTEGITSTLPSQRPPSSASWNSFPIPTTASKYASTSFTSDNEIPASFHPTAEYMPSRMTTPQPTSYVAEQSVLAYIRPEETNANTRPPTVTAYHGEQLDQMLPPKRDLPFLKSSQKSVRGADDVIPDSQQSQATQQFMLSQTQPNPAQPSVEETQKAPVSVESQFASYLSAPTPGRIAFLENWMCELIDDDHFLTLCEDVEATWKRFAFGRER